MKFLKVPTWMIEKLERPKSLHCRNKTEIVEPCSRCVMSYFSHQTNITHPKATAAFSTTTAKPHHKDGPLTRMAP